MVVVLWGALTVSSCHFSTQPDRPRAKVAEKPTQMQVQKKAGVQGMEPKVIEMNIARSIDRKRIARGKKGLRYHPGLAKIAKVHARLMQKEYLKTGSLTPTHKGFKKRVHVAVLKHDQIRVAENALIRVRPANLATIIAMWEVSSLHKKAMYGDWTHTGVGVIKSKQGVFFVNQFFGVMDPAFVPSDRSKKISAGQ